MVIDFYTIITTDGEELDYWSAGEAITAARQLAEQTSATVDVYEHYLSGDFIHIMAIQPKSTDGAPDRI